MKKGFITLTNGNERYKHLVGVLVESVLEFTPYEIEVFGVNTDYKHSSSRVISKRINLEHENFETICFSKIKSCIMSDFDTTIHLDSDIVVSPEIVNVFNLLSENDSIKFPLHPWDGINQRIIDCINYIGATEKTQPYVHAATFIFNKKAKDFLNESFEISQKMLRDGFSPINQDETIFNCLLWKNKIKNWFVDCYDPYHEYFKSTIGLSEQDKEKFICSNPYSEIENFKTNFYLSHGCKDYQEAKIILNLLKNNLPR